MDIAESMSRFGIMASLDLPRFPVFTVPPIFTWPVAAAMQFRTLGILRNSKIRRGTGQQLEGFIIHPFEVGDILTQCVNIVVNKP